LASPSAAQQPDADPRAVVTAAFSAQDSGDIRTLVSLLDPDGMMAFKERQLQQDSIFADLMSRHPDSRAPRRTLLQVVFRVKDRAEFARLSLPEVLSRWFEQTMKGRSRIKMMWPDGQPTRRDILGEVPESPEVVHVVFRETDRPPAIAVSGFVQEPRIRVITTRRTPEGWRVGLNGGLVLGEGGDWGIGYDSEEEDTVVSPR
jgi:hypothetical protein